MTNRTAALLALEDGTTWPGTALGAIGERPGEVIFNTAMTGYQEVLTDPSYYGQIVVMTAPQIGNTGVNIEDEESQKPWLSGFVVRAASPRVSNWRATSTAFAPGKPVRNRIAMSSLSLSAAAPRAVSFSRGRSSGGSSWIRKVAMNGSH